MAKQKFLRPPQTRPSIFNITYLTSQKALD